MSWNQPEKQLIWSSVLFKVILEIDCPVCGFPPGLRINLCTVLNFSPVNRENRSKRLLMPWHMLNIHSCQSYFLNWYTLLYQKLLLNPKFESDINQCKFTIPSWKGINWLENTKQSWLTSFLDKRQFENFSPNFLYYSDPAAVEPFEVVKNDRCLEMPRRCRNLCVLWRSRNARKPFRVVAAKGLRWEIINEKFKL